MREFKNLVNQADFKILFEEHKIKDTTLFKTLNEAETSTGMDFSNRTGFSESLVGRAINKVFSFVATRVEMAILRKHKNTLDGIYEKAVVSTIVSMKLTEKLKKERKKVSVQELIGDTLEYTQTQTIEEGSTSTKEISKLFNLQETQIEYYKELQTLQKEIIEIQNKEHLNSELQTIQAQAQVQQKDEEKIVVFKKTEDEKQNLDNQVSMMNSLIDRLQDEDIKGENAGMLATISVKLAEEINFTSDEVSKTQLVKFKNDIDDELSSFSDDEKKFDGKKYEERINDFKDNKTPNEDDKIKKDIDLSQYKDDYQKIIKLYDKGKGKLPKKLYYKVANLIAADKLASLDNNEKLNRFKEARELLKQNNFVLEQSIIQFFDKYEKIFEGVGGELVKTNTDVAKVQPTNTDVAKVQQSQAQVVQPNQAQTILTEKIAVLKEKITEFTKTIKEEQKISIENTFNKKTTIKSVIKIVPGDNQETKDAINQVGDDDANNINDVWEELSEEEQTEFVKQSIKFVNKELLKIVALKAEALYNVDDYKDERGPNGIYSRVNFSTTSPDKKKLERKWLIMVSSVKASYMKYFSSTGSFPEDLDPIALMNSDNKEQGHRNLFNEYKEDTSKDGDDSNESIPIKCNYEKLGLNENENGDQMFFDVQTNTGKMKIALLLRRIQKNKIMIYHFKGLVNYGELLKDMSDCENLSSDDIKSMVKKHYLTSETIKNMDIEIQKLYKVFRPSDGTNSNDSKTLYVRNSEKMKKGTKIFLNLNLNIVENKFTVATFNKMYEFVDLKTFENASNDIKFSVIINNYATIKDESVFNEYIKHKDENETVEKIVTNIDSQYDNIVKLYKKINPEFVG